MDAPLSALLCAARGALTTSEVAARAGVHIRSIQNWEAGKLPTKAALSKVIRACRCGGEAKAVILAAWDRQKAAANLARRGVA
jgi:hypothetical protein